MCSCVYELVMKVQGTVGGKGVRGALVYGTVMMESLLSLWEGHSLSGEGQESHF